MNTRRTVRPLARVFAAAVLVLPATALAQGFSASASGSGAAPMNGPYDDEYGVGFMGGLGVYGAPAAPIGFGLRVDGGRISAEEEFEGRLSGGSGLEYGAAGPAIRLRPLRAIGLEKNQGNRGLYLEMAGGLGLLEDQLEPAISPGAGYLFDLGGVGFGPTARYLQIIADDDDVTGGEDVRLMTVGLELTFLDRGGSGQTRRPTEERPPYQPPPQPEPVVQQQVTPSVREVTPQPAPIPPLPPPTTDIQAEEVAPVAGQDQDDDDQAALTAAATEPIEETLLFNHGSVMLSAEARRELDRIIQLYQERGAGENWTSVRLAGHSDSSGSEEVNMAVSRQRAETVRDYLVSGGIPESLIDVQAFGEDQPLVSSPANPEEERQNRRVQIEVQRGGASPQE